MSFEFTPIESKTSTKVRLSQGKYVIVHKKGDAPEKKYVMTEGYKDVADRIKNFEIRNDDVWVASYPKSGTTWTEEMVWLITHDLDYEAAKAEKLQHRSVFLEFSSMAPTPAPDTVDIVNNMKSPRNIKTHLHAALLPEQIWQKKTKVIYVARDPKDVFVSFYHHFQILMGYTGGLEEFVEDILVDKVYYAPYWDNILDFWKLRNLDHVLFLRYEDMKKDLLKEVKRVCEFLNKKFTNEQLDKLVDHLQFDNMKNNASCNNAAVVEKRKKDLGLNLPEVSFIRQGKTGGWRKEMSEELGAKIDEWSRKHTKGTDFPLIQ